MPIYAFACSACGHHFDRLQKLSDPDPSACPVCGVDAIKRQLTAPSFRLSGSGWYETDFKKDGDKKRNLSEKPEVAAASSDTKADAPAAAAKPAEAKAGDGKADATPKTPAKAEPATVSKPASGAA
ncbi:MAG: regulatory protein FmdB family [Xanthomonadaceae bacterium]|nr:regulatory protein FmdB family [Xanthomonadaceae bacterium]